MTKEGEHNTPVEETFDRLERPADLQDRQTEVGSCKEDGNNCFRKRVLKWGPQKQYQRRYARWLQNNHLI